MERHVARKVLLPAVLACTLPAQDGSAPLVERTGKHFAIRFHRADLDDATAGSLADQALATVEDLWPILQKLTGASGRDEHEIHLYRDKRDFDEAARAVRAFRHPSHGFATRSGVGHACLWPALAPDLFADTGLPQCTKEELLRVAAEQVVTPLAPGADRGEWMLWALVMGAVETATNPKREHGVSPAYDLRRTPVVRQRQESSSLTVTHLLRPPERMGTFEDWYWKLCYAALLAELYEDASSQLGRKLLKVKSRAASGHDPTAHFRHDALVAVSGKDMAKTELRLGKLMARMKPTWEMRRPVWQRDGERYLMAGTEKEPATIAGVEPLPALDYFIAGRLELGPGRDPCALILFGWEEDGASVVAVRFGEGGAKIRVWTKDEGWADKASGDAPIRIGASFAFRIELDRARLTVRVNDEETCSWRHGSREIHGTWSVEVADCIVRFEDLRCGPLE